MQGSTWEKWILAALAAAVGYPLLRLLLPACLPFLLGFALALAAEPAVGWLHRKGRLPRPAAAGIGVTGVFLLAGTVLTLLFSLVLRQLGHLTAWLPAAAEAVSQGGVLLQQWLLSLADRTPAGIRETLTGMVQGLFQGGDGILLQAAQKLPQMAGSALGSLSNGIIWIFTAVLAAYMISARLPQLTRRVPKKWRNGLVPAFKTFRGTIGRWLLAQGKLATVTLMLLSAGFLLLRIRNGLLWAVLVTMVDILPVLGVGTVLIPWSLVSYLQGDSGRALGLLALFGVVWLVRSVLEPKLIGSELGLDPLLALLCIYGGFRLWGIGGMLLAPVAAICLVQLWRIRHGQESDGSP